jgi:cell division septation protein DedD
VVAVSLKNPSKKKLAALVRSDGYSVQVGACKTSRCVERFLEDVKKAGFTPHTKKTASRKLTLIRVGSYKTAAETRSTIQRLKAKGFKGSYAVKQ